MSPMEFQLAFSAAVLIPAVLLVWAKERGDRELPKRVRIEVFGATRLPEARSMYRIPVKGPWPMRQRYSSNKRRSGSAS